MSYNALLLLPFLSNLSRNSGNKLIFEVDIEFSAARLVTFHLLKFLIFVKFTSKLKLASSSERIGNLGKANHHSLAFTKFKKFCNKNIYIILFNKKFQMLKIIKKRLKKPTFKNSNEIIFYSLPTLAIKLCTRGTITQFILVRHCAILCKYFNYLNSSTNTSTVSTTFYKPS